MVATERRNTARRVAFRYLRAALHREAGFSMDMFARLSLLEGAAGVIPGSWLRKGARGFGDALEHFGPHLAAAWTTTRNEGLYDKAIAVAAKYLRDVPDVDAVDLVQDMMVGSSKPGGPDRSRIFYTVGKKLTGHANDLGAGDILPRDGRIHGALGRWVRQGALDVLKNVRTRRTQTFAPDQSLQDPTRSMSVQQLDEDKRAALILLALQSPGGPGRELRRTIDRLVDQSFPSSARSIVKLFLQKVAEPRYRSPTQMKKMVRHFDPSKWFGQAVNIIRKEIMRELGVSAQYLTNVLGSKGRNVVKFMREKVGKDSGVKRVIEQLGQEIDLLEPGVSRVGKDLESELTEEQIPKEPHEVLIRWMQESDEDEREAGLDESFEKDEFLDWDLQNTHGDQWGRGAVPLRVARRYLLQKTAFMGPPPRFRPAFLRYVQGRSFPNPDSRGRQRELSFFTLPMREQKRVYEEWRKSRLEWAQQFKPDGLCAETRITKKNFEKLLPGDVIWRSDSPVRLHRVIGLNRSGWRAKDPVLDMVQFERDKPDRDLDTRHLTRSALQDDVLEYHRVPGMGPRAERELARMRLPGSPRKGWPRFDDVGLGDAKRDEICETFKEMQKVRDLRQISYRRLSDRLRKVLGEKPKPRVMQEFMHELREWIGELEQAARQESPVLDRQAQLYRAMKMKLDEGLAEVDRQVRREKKKQRGRKRMLTPDLDGLSDQWKEHFDASVRQKMTPVYAEAFSKLDEGAIFDQEFADEFLKKLKKRKIPLDDRAKARAVGAFVVLAKKLAQRDGMPRKARERLSHVTEQAMAEVRRRLQGERDARQEREKERRRKEQAPPRHRDRSELRGGGKKQMDTPAKLAVGFIAQVLPEGVSAEVKEAAKEQLKGATYAQLETLRKAAEWLIENWEDDRSSEHVLVKHLGYDEKGVKDLGELLGRKLGDVNGRVYHREVLQVANKHDLESEDVDAIHDFRINAKPRKRELSDQEKFKKFKAKAKSETRERMENMPLEDFVVLYESVFKKGRGSRGATEAA